MCIFGGALSSLEVGILLKKVSQSQKQLLYFHRKSAAVVYLALPDMHIQEINYVTM